jgi:L-ascorbate metabolism protein UlaG (beta-lactamase superfamily)
MAGYEIVGPSHRVLVDPFLTGNPLAPCTHQDIDRPDLILVSHAAYDHFGDTAAIALRTGAPVVCGADVARILSERGVPETQLRRTIWGVVVEVAGMMVRPVECHHWSWSTLADGTPVTGAPLAFIFETEPGVRIYHYGDTSIFDMSLIGRLYTPTVGLIGCTVAAELTANDGGAGRVVSGELSPSEAAAVVEMLGIRVAFASHYLAINDDVREFLEHVEQLGGPVPVAALAPLVGDVIVTDGTTASVEVRV